ncbi:hypothetical protein FZEAL_8830 [Fusarium zealandicum]|uniref:Uncharacterized protein n=1 Tax=Fusarium zealandicum TaxID=1053134 RepID=A0A8H4UD46_9HYPO|nr:hypothetical protein FZEAL_8830 [Fusarium zealandicum]
MFVDRKEIGINFEPVYNEYDDFYTASDASFPLEGWDNPSIRQGSRLFPAENWANEIITTKTFEAVKGSIEDYGWLIAFNTFAGPEGYSDTAVNPAFRTTVIHGIGAVFWQDVDDEAAKKKSSDSLTDHSIQR